MEGPSCCRPSRMRNVAPMAIPERTHGSPLTVGPAPRRSPEAGLACTEELRDLAASLVDPSASEALGLYVFRPDDEGAALPLGIARAVFQETFGAPPGVFDQEYAPYHDASLLICVLDHKRLVPAGMIRLILPSASGLKTLNEIEEVWGRSAQEVLAGAGLEYDPARLWNLGSLVVAPEYRTAPFQGLVTLALVQASSIIGSRCGVPWWVATLHVPVLRMLQWKLHHPFHEFAGLEPRTHPRTYQTMGCPVWGDLPAWWARLEARDPVLHGIMARGTGLEPMVRPADWDRAVETARSIRLAVA